MRCFCYLSVIAAGALLALPALPRAVCWEPRRESPARLSAPVRLPRVDSPIPRVERQADRDLLTFAAGGIRLQAPLGWRVQVTPFGREMRLLLTPPESKPTGGMPQDGIWIGYEVLENAESLSDEALAENLKKSLHQAIGENASPAAPRQVDIAGGRALLAPFTAAARYGQERRFEGFHLAAVCRWGICRLHASAPVERIAQRRGAFEAVLQSMSLAAPVRAETPFNEATSDAARLWGAWKSYNGRLVIRADGRLTIEPDPATPVTLDALPTSRRAQSEARPLRGTYAARGDVLEIEWDDGSRLNLRWRLRGAQLLATDHEGRISLMNQLLE